LPLLRVLYRPVEYEIEVTVRRIQHSVPGGIKVASYLV